MKVKAHKKDLNKKVLTYADMEAIYYEILDWNFRTDSSVGKLDLQVYGITDEKCIAINLNNVILDMFPAIYAKENNEYVRQTCLSAAIFCFVAGDRVFGPDNNDFRIMGSISDLADYLYETVCIRAEQLQHL